MVRGPATAPSRCSTGDCKEAAPGDSLGDAIKCLRRGPVQCRATFFKCLAIALAQHSDEAPTEEELTSRIVTVENTIDDLRKRSVRLKAIEAVARDETIGNPNDDACRCHLEIATRVVARGAVQFAQAMQQVAQPVAVLLPARCVTAIVWGRDASIASAFTSSHAVSPPKSASVSP